MCNCGGSKKAGAPANSRPVGPADPRYFWNGPKQAAKPAEPKK